MLLRPIARPIAVLAAAVCLSQPALATDVRWLTQTQQQNAQFPTEAAAIEAATAAGFKVDRNEFQVLGLNLADALRMARAGTFQIVTTQIGSAAKDDPFLEGIDLIGVSTDMTELKTAVDAYRDAFNARLGERFGVKALAIWPFGPQVFFCNQPVESLDSLQGLKVRSFTASMSEMLADLGATPVTLSFPEVYPALQRGVASCGVTSPTSANTGKWPEVTSHLYPLAVSGSVQAHIVNLEWFNALPPEEQAALTKVMSDMEAKLWDLATTTNDTALACSTGGDCPEGGLYTKYDMTLVAGQRRRQGAGGRDRQDQDPARMGQPLRRDLPGLRQGLERDDRRRPRPDDPVIAGSDRIDRHETARRPASRSRPIATILALVAGATVVILSLLIVFDIVARQPVPLLAAGHRRARRLYPGADRLARSRLHADRSAAIRASTSASASSRRSCAQILHVVALAIADGLRALHGDARDRGVPGHDRLRQR